MKIIFTSKANCEATWNRLQPQQRYSSDLIARAVKLPWEEAILVPIGANVTFGIIDEDSYPETLKELRDNIENGAYKKLELKPAE